MIEVYINSVLRADIKPQIGGSLEQTAEHTTSSAISVKIPVNAAGINTCDYIQFKENSVVIFAGTVLGVQQLDLGYSGQIDHKIFNLSIASNADYIASKFVDMSFPAGASVKHIIMGNYSENAWYNAALGQFAGVFAQCIASEGITLGTVDDFTAQVLDDSALLWGMSVYDLLDQLCSTVGGWWEITPDKVFSMRYTASRDAAPFPIDSAAPIYELTPSVDAYKLFSGVRVVGGVGRGQHLWERTYTNDPAGSIFYKGNVLFLKYPVHSFRETYPLYQHRYGPSHEEIWVEWKVGIKGLHDDDAAYQALTSYGSTEVTLKDGYSFYTLPEVQDDDIFIWLEYYPQIKMYSRLVDDALVNQIKAQRGGSGLIEYLLEDNSLSTYGDTISAGRAFLRDNAARSKQVSFKTSSPGFAVGQYLTGDLPYYGIDAIYQVAAITATIISDTDSGLLWEYEITGSSAMYQDSLKNLFYSVKQIRFKIGTDFPAADGRQINSEIEIQTTLTLFAYHAMTWTELQVTYSSWTSFQATYASWASILRVFSEVSQMGNYLTAEAKSRLARVLSGIAAATNYVNCITGMNIMNGASYLVQGESPVEQRLLPDGIESVYYLSPESVLSAISDKLTIRSSVDGWHDNQSIPLVIDKTAGNPQGAYALTIVKRDVII